MPGEQFSVQAGGLAVQVAGETSQVNLFYFKLERVESTPEC